MRHRSVMWFQDRATWFFKQVKFSKTCYLSLILVTKLRCTAMCLRWSPKVLMGLKLWSQWGNRDTSYLVVSNIFCQLSQKMLLASTYSGVIGPMMHHHAGLPKRNTWGARRGTLITSTFAIQACNNKNWSTSSYYLFTSSSTQYFSQSIDCPVVKLGYVTIFSFILVGKWISTPSPSSRLKSRA